LVRCCIAFSAICSLLSWAACAVERVANDFNTSKNRRGTSSIRDSS
jgi:hypothetical protein